MFQAPTLIENNQTLVFGRYIQDGNSPEPIRWQVLEVDNYGYAYVLSERILDAKHLSKTDFAYETSDLRKWLNSEFLNAAFTSDEQRYIASIPVGNEEDKISILSQEDAVNRAFGFHPDIMHYNDRRGKQPTKYALERLPEYWDNKQVFYYIQSPSNEKSHTLSRDGALRTIRDLEDAWGVVPCMKVRVNLGEEQIKEFTLHEESLENILKAKPQLSSDKKTLVFGNYYYKKDSKEKAPVEWNVVEIKNNTALCICKEVLEESVFDYFANEYYSSKIRTWLNTDFCDELFSNAEKHYLVTEHHAFISEDKVFLPNYELLIKQPQYDGTLPSLSKYCSKYIEYKISYKFSDEDEDRCYGKYWLSDSVADTDKVYYILRDEYLKGDFIDKHEVGVVPCIRVKLDY